MNIFSNRYLIKRRQIAFMRDVFAGRNFGIVVDVGVGTAPYQRFITHEGYIGVDKEDRGGVSDVLIADVNNRIPLDDGVADLVLSAETLEHLKEPQRALKEMYRILKPGGVLVLTTPMTWQIHEEPNDFFRYTRFGLEYMLEQAGFSDLKVRPSNGYYYSLFQLMSVPLSSRLFAPVVAILNLLGLLAERVSTSPRLPLDYQVTASKHGE